MISRRWKQLGNLKKNPDHHLFFEPIVSSSSSSSLSSVDMPPRVRNPEYTVAETLQLGPGETLGRGDGTWEDIDFYFVRSGDNPPSSEYYYRNLSRVFGGPDGSGGREMYNQADLDRKFLSALGTRYLCASLQKGLSFTSTQIDDALKAIFQFPDGFEWRWPEAHERIYHRPLGGYIGVSLEHLRSMRPCLH